MFSLAEKQRFLLPLKRDLARVAAIPAIDRDLGQKLKRSFNALAASPVGPSLLPQFASNLPAALRDMTEADKDNLIISLGDTLVRDLENVSTHFYPACSRARKGQKLADTIGRPLPQETTAQTLTLLKSAMNWHLGGYCYSPQDVRRVIKEILMTGDALGASKDDFHIPMLKRALEYGLKYSCFSRQDIEEVTKDVLDAGDTIGASTGAFRIPVRSMRTDRIVEIVIRDSAKAAHAELSQSVREAYQAIDKMTDNALENLRRDLI